MYIRAEAPADVERIWALNAAAFADNSEADLVDRLRESTQCLSLVAVKDDQAARSERTAQSEQTTQSEEIVGHILFSPAHIDGHADLSVAGLAPMAVLPEKQNMGIGTRLVKEGIQRCRDSGIDVIIVLGHAHFYPRFGFVPAVRYNIRSEYDVPEDVFMILELTPGALRGVTGTARYHDAFSAL